MTDSLREWYRLERKISSKGAFGDVWLATDILLDRPVAVKCPKATEDPIRRERVLVEARMLARLNHPNITQIYDAFFDEDDNSLYLVLEFVDGKDLSDIIGRGTPLSLDLILEITAGILRALSYAHQQGLVHHDIKAANVMIGDDVKLTDFGLATLRSILQRGTGFVAGTPAYMAPEQVEERASSNDQNTQLGIAYTLHEMGHIASYSDQVEARRFYEKSLMLFRALGDQWGTAMPLSAFGHLPLAYYVSRRNSGPPHSSKGSPVVMSGAVSRKSIAEICCIGG